MKVEYGELTEEALVGYGKDVERARDRLIFGLVGLMIALIAFLGILAPLVSAFADVVSWTATP